MARIDQSVWERLKPKIEEVLSSPGGSHKAVIEELKQTGFNISKAQLNYQVNRWGLRKNLSESAWGYINNKIKKRSQLGKSSKVISRGRVLSQAQVSRGISTHNMPTLFSAASGIVAQLNFHESLAEHISASTPKTPTDLNLLICTPSPASEISRSPSLAFPITQHSTPGNSPLIPLLPWSQFENKLWKDISTLISAVKSPHMYQTYTSDASQYRSIRTFQLQDYRISDADTQRHLSLIMSDSNRYKLSSNNHILTKSSSWSDKFTVLCIFLFKLCNNFYSKNSKLDSGINFNTSEERKLILEFFKSLAMEGVDWNYLLTSSHDLISQTIVEKLYTVSIMEGDEFMVKATLDAGANPNQQITMVRLRHIDSALNVSIVNGYSGSVKHLLQAGAVYDQKSLAYAVLHGDLETANYMLNSQPHLDLSFDYGRNGLGDYGSFETSKLTHRIDLISLVCSFRHLHEYPIFVANCPIVHQDRCLAPRKVTILKYLLDHTVTVDLNTMTVASSCDDIVALHMLHRYHNSVEGINSRGLSPLDAAVMNPKPQPEIISLLLDWGATVNKPGVDHESVLHRICRRRDRTQEIAQIYNLLVKKGGANINHHFRVMASREGNSESDHMSDKADKFITETPLEHSIVARNEGLALDLLSRGCVLTGRGILLSSRFGALIFLQTLLCDGTGQIVVQASIMRVAYQLALKWEQDSIVIFLLANGVLQYETDILEVLQYRRPTNLSTAIQIGLVNNISNLDISQSDGASYLEEMFRTFSVEAIRYTLKLYPKFYDSGALCAAVLRASDPDSHSWSHDRLEIQDIELLVNRRVEALQDNVLENTAIMIAAVHGRLDIIKTITFLGTTPAMNTGYFSHGLVSMISSDRWRLRDQTPVRHYWRFSHSRLARFHRRQCSPLMAAALAKSISVAEEIVDYLLACSYQPDSWAVLSAVSTNRISLLQKYQHLDNWRSIVEFEDRPSWCPTALQLVIQLKQFDMVELLLLSGIDVDDKPIYSPKYYLVERFPPRTALQSAVELGEFELVKRLIDAGANINAPAGRCTGATALQLASMQGYIEIVRHLLKLGADINAPKAHFYGRTPLEGAACYGHQALLQLLLDSGAATEGRHREQYIRAVILAEQQNNHVVASLLRQHGEWSTEDYDRYEQLKFYDEDYHLDSDYEEDEEGGEGDDF